MTRTSTRVRRGARGVLLSLFLLGCRPPEQDDRDLLLTRAHAARLVGAWVITLTLERPLSALADSATRARPATGDLAFTDNRRGALTIEEFGVVTNRGVADIDLHGFAIPLGGNEPVDEMVARTVPSAPDPGSLGAQDSLYLLLRTADGDVTFSASGILTGDVATGRWTAEYLRSVASGRFTMHRRTVPVATVH